MKTNTLKKATIASMAIAMGAAIAGSISGTVAWYQYSTRSTVAYKGASVKCSESLQVRIAKGTYDSGWKQDLTTDDVADYLKSAVGRNTADVANLRPVTSGPLASGVATSFYKSPIYQYGGAYSDNNSWKAATEKADYVEIPLEFRVADVNGERSGSEFANFLAKKLYLTDFTLQSSSTGSKRDITDAVRVSFDATNDVTFSKEGGDTVVAGYLDLNNDKEPDTVPQYDWQTGEPAKVVYGAEQTAEESSFATIKAVSTKLVKATSGNATSYYADDTNPRAIIGNELGSTNDDGTGFAVTVRIYLEGWQKLKNADDKEADTLWADDKFVGAQFNLGLRFSCEAADVE